jgi:uncharacterized protein (AIM24 family)
MSTPAGWYPDPEPNSALVRYWDGQQWTEHTQDPAAAGTDAGVGAHDDSGVTGEAGTGDVTTGEVSSGAAAQGAATQPPVAGAAGMTHGAGVGGIETDLLTDDRFAEVGSDQRVVKQNSRLLKVVLGPEVLARQGSMVAFQGQIDFTFEGSGMAKFMKKAVTGEGLSLMRCTGQGELFLADRGYQVHIIHLNGSGLTVNGKNVLAFEPTLKWDIERIKGAGIVAGGLFNTRLEGQGWVAITTDGDPVVLRTDAPTFVDTDAVVAWSSNLTTSLNKTIKAGAVIGRGSGEAVQLTFGGDGIVIVQPSEGFTIPAG